MAPLAFRKLLPNLPMTRDLRHVMAQFPKNLVAQIVWRVETGLLGKFNSPWLLVQPSCVQ